ncbi:MAG: hypothetical protein WCQ65_11460 [Fermentimonas sp.]
MWEGQIMDSNENSKIVLDPHVVNVLKNRIYVMERENHKTKKFKDNEMVDKVRKLIEAEVEKSDY